MKQGTILGPILCCSSTAKVNTIGRKTKTVITPEANIEALINVDDIGAAGTVKSIEEVGKNLALMEEVEGFTFSKEKSNYMIVKGKRRAAKNKALR